MTDGAATSPGDESARACRGGRRDRNGRDVLAGVRLFNPLPSLGGRSVSSALLDTDGTKLGRSIAPLAAQHPGLTGIYAKPDARDSFAARVPLARSAERSLDIQYCIWRCDLTGWHAAVPEYCEIVELS
jgi:phosphatidylserine/phosphatidylglycerophosphate/cardiolipin synthase-like enzyme